MQCARTENSGSNPSTIHSTRRRHRREPAILSYGVQPVGTAIPRPPAIVLINFDPRTLAAIDWVMPADPQPHFVYPSVNRDRKGGRLLRAAPAPVNPAGLPQPQRVDADPPATTPAPETAPATDMQAPAPAAAQFEAEVPPAGAIGAPHRNPEPPGNAGTAARPERQRAGQGGEVSRRSGLFRGARRAAARAGGGRAGGDEPGVLGLLPGQRLQRRFSERQAFSRLPIYLRVRAQEPAPHR
jgi:hypothetical protein